MRRGKAGADTFFHRFSRAMVICHEAESLGQLIDDEKSAGRMAFWGLEAWVPDLERARNQLNKTIVELGGKAELPDVNRAPTEILVDLLGPRPRIALAFDIEAAS